MTSYFCIPVPYDEKDIFFGCSLQKVLYVFIESFNFSFFSITGQGIDLDYCDIEKFALEMTRDQIASICWIIEKAKEFQKNIYFCFIDYGKAFECV